jgi:dihydrofolate synthase / folylpolyglutamate synthase
MMTYAQTLDYLYSRLPMFHRIGAAAYKADLSNTIALCNALGNPENKFRSVHIAGTNGKGSVSHMLASILQESGYKTGLYTSPHLVDFRERIRINGKMIEQGKVTNFVEKYSKIIEEIEPSFFEVTVGMAFEYFAEQKVDIAVIETGLGGRLDSTNIITPLLSVITNISYDHQNLLGNTLPEIAGEKAGIIKQNIPVIIGRHQPETDPVFISKASSEKSEIHFAEDEYIPKSSKIENGLLFVEFENRGHTQNLTVHESGKKILSVASPLAGNYQLENIATVLEASDILSGQLPKINHESMLRGIRNVITNTGLRGRWEVLKNDPLVVCDVGHNEAGLKSVFEQAMSIPHQNLHIVFGMVKDKDLEKAVSRLPKNAIYYFCQPDIPRALDVHELFMQASKSGLNGNLYPSVKEAYATAISQAERQDIVLITGSFFVVAEILDGQQ